MEVLADKISIPSEPYAIYTKIFGTQSKQTSYSPGQSSQVGRLSRQTSADISHPALIYERVQDAVQGIWIAPPIYLLRTLSLTIANSAGNVPFMQSKVAYLVNVAHARRRIDVLVVSCCVRTWIRFSISCCCIGFPFQ